MSKAERFARRLAGVFASFGVGATLAFLAMPAALLANPVGEQVTHGTVEFARSAGALTINQRSDKAIVHWQDFSIAAGERVDINQPGALSAILNRVTGGNPSQLFGQLKSNGQVYLINPNGIIVGRGATIDTGAFTASTLDVADEDFLNGGDLTFKGDSTANLTNAGTIHAAEGDVVLIARRVVNEGTITAPKGGAYLAAGSEVLLADAADPRILVKSKAGETLGGTGVENRGVIEAARVELHGAGGSVYELAVNNTGTIKATAVAKQNGRVLLVSEGGKVAHSGKITARNADGGGGEVYIGGGKQGGQDTKIKNAAEVEVAKSGVIDVSAESGSDKNGGTAIVWADNATRFYGTILARGGGQGGDGGFVEVSGKHTLVFEPASPIDLTAEKGTTGTLLLDPDAIIVSTDPDSGISQSGGDPNTITGPGASIINNFTLSNALDSANVVLQGSLASVGDIRINAPVFWSAATKLTIKSTDNIYVSSAISASSPGSAVDFQLGKLEVFDAGGLDTHAFTSNLVSSSVIEAGKISVGVNADATQTVTANSHLINAIGGIYLAPVKTSVLQINGPSAGIYGDVDLAPHEVVQNEIGTLIVSVGAGRMPNSFKVVDDSGGLDVRINSSPSVANGVKTLDIRTRGDLKILNGSFVALKSGGSAQALFASLAGNFINQAGNFVLRNSASNQRVLIYSGISTATQLGGINATQAGYGTIDSMPPSSFGTDGVDRVIYREVAITTIPLITPTIFTQLNPPSPLTILQTQVTLTDPILNNPLINLNNNQPGYFNYTPTGPSPEVHIDLHEQTLNVVPMGPIMPAEIGTLIANNLDFLRGSMPALLVEILNSDAFRDANLSAAARQLLEDFLNGRVSAEEFQRLLNSGDAGAKSVAALLIPKVGARILTKAPPLTNTEQHLVNYLGELVQANRQRTAQIAQAKVAELIAQKAALLQTNPIAVYGGADIVYPDVIRDASAEALAAQLVGAAGGAAVGGTAAGLSVALVGAKAIFSSAYSAAGGVATYIGPSTTAAAGGTAAIVAAGVAIGVVRTIQLAQSVSNQTAFNNYVANANNPVSASSLYRGGGAGQGEVNAAMLVMLLGALK